MYIMFRSVLFLALFDTTLSISRNLPQICEKATSFTCKPKTRIPWTECGGEYLPACDATRCCTYKPINVRIWNDAMMEGVRNGSIHIDAIGDAFRSSFLIKAAQDPTEKNLELAIKLIGDGASVNLQDETEMTALMFAAKLGNANLVKKLLDANASTAIIDENELNAMMYATNRGHVQAVTHLLDHCAEVSVEAVNAASGDLKKTLTRAQKNPLIAAVLRESVGGLNHILQNQARCLNGISIDSQDEEEWTALTHATNMDRPDMMDILLARNAQIGTELPIAAEKGCVLMGKRLVAKGADVTADNEKAIVAAVANSRAAFVKFLLEKGASADARNENDEPVLFVATAKDNANIVSILVRNRASISATNCSNTAQTTRCEDSKVCYTALTLAMKEEYENVAARLLDGPNNMIRTDQVLCVDGQNYSPLTWALKYENWGIVSRLLTKCADVSFQTGEKTSLEIAQDTKNTDIIAKLEDAKWPYITAIKAEGVQSLSSFEGDVCNRSHVNEMKEGRSPLMFAVELGKKQIVDELIDLNADVNAKNNDGQTALMLAAKKNNAIVVRLLQSSEIEVSAQDKDERSALMIAAGTCSTDNVQSFVGYDGIKVDAADNEKQTALMHSVRCSAEVVQSLLEKGANVGMRGDRGRTALMQAVDYCNAPVVSVLLEKGNANLSIRYEDNETVQMHAVKKCEVEVVNHLVNHSSKEQINAKKLAATPLMIAVENNRSLDIIESLLRHPNVSVAPTKRRTDSALVRAVRRNRADIARPILAKMAKRRWAIMTDEIEYNKTITALGVAVKENMSVEIIELLLEYNASVDHVFLHGLSMAGRNEEVVEMIQNTRWPQLKKIQNKMSGLNIGNVVNFVGRNRNHWQYLDDCMSFFEPQTMFMAAATANNTDAMEKLLRFDKKHRYIDRTCDTGETPLCIAARKNHVEIAKLLLNECPNVDLRCDKRNYEARITPDKMNTYGNSALEIAKENGFSDIAQEIRYKKWILLGKIARNGSKSVEELRKEHLEGGHKCDVTIAKRSYEIDPSAKCDRGETVTEWAIQYGREDVLAEIGAAFSSFTAPTTTTVTPAPGNTTSTDPKDGDDDDFAWEYLGFLAIIPVCVGIAYAVWRYYPTSTDQASEIPSSKIPSNVASEIPSSKIPSNVASIKTGSMVKSNFKPTSRNNRNHV